MKNPYYRPVRIPYTREDFQRKPDYDAGDWVINSSQVNDWKIISAKRLIKHGTPIKKYKHGASLGSSFSISPTLNCSAAKRIEKHG